MIIKKLGIGIDIIEIERFKKRPYSTNHKFYEKIFLSSEIKYCIKYKNSYSRFAGKFAIKEAVKKSIQEHIELLNIETSHLNSKPIIKLRGKLSSKYMFVASISHEKHFAVGMVISERVN